MSPAFVTSCASAKGDQGRSRSEERVKDRKRYALEEECRKEKVLLFGRSYIRHDVSNSVFV